MDNQQLNEFNLSQEIIDEIRSGNIKSRKQVYRIFKISKHSALAKKIRQELDRLDLLVYKKHSRESIKIYVQEYINVYGRLPIANSVSNIIVKVAQKLYGTWNRFLLEEFGDQNQRRYADEFTDEELLNTIANYVNTYKKLPNREEFDGKTKDMPYWESFMTRFKFKRWSQVLGKALVNNPNIRIYYNSKNGFGKLIIYGNNIYLSNQEYLIGKYLTEHDIKFDKEVEYENCKFVFDFYLPEHDTYIEYYGIATKEYKEKILKKQSMYNGRNVIEIYKHDNTVGKLHSEVQRLQSLLVKRDGIVHQ